MVVHVFGVTFPLSSIFSKPVGLFTSMPNKFALGHFPENAREKIFWLLLPDNRILQSLGNHVINRLFVEASGAFSLPAASTALGSSVSL